MTRVNSYAVTISMTNSVTLDQTDRMEGLAWICFCTHDFVFPDNIVFTLNIRRS